MRHLILLSLMLAASLGFAHVVFTEGTPTEVPTDNACYEGGAWEGLCDWPTDAEDEWAWTCGWYYARVSDGRINVYDAPEECLLLPIFAPTPRPISSEEPSPTYSPTPITPTPRRMAACYPHETGLSSLATFVDQPNRFYNLEVFNTSNCRGSFNYDQTYNRGVFTAPDAAAALVLCQQSVSAFHHYSYQAEVLGSLNALGYTTAPANLWLCKRTRI